MKSPWKVDGAVQLVLAAALISLTVWTCTPAAPMDAATHDAATCEVCSHPNSRVGESDAHLPLRLAARHLSVCGACRENGMTPARLTADNGGTRCYAVQAGANGEE
jgi:hypothetical protein